MNDLCWYIEMPSLSTETCMGTHLEVVGDG